MLTRRRFLQAGALAGVALALPPSGGLVAPPRTRAMPAGPLLDPLRQPKFVNALPNPLDPSFVFQPASAPGGAAHYEIAVSQFTQGLGIYAVSGAPLQTTVWGYGTASQAPTFPGRTILARRDEPITVRWRNELRAGGNHLPHLLPVDTSVHWALMEEHEDEHGLYAGPVPIVAHLHGGHTRSDSDGLPDAWFTPGFNRTGRLFNETYTYDNDQEAATLWYHDHALGITRLNVYAGLAGFYLLRDEVEDELIAGNALPSGAYEIPVVIQDRMFYVDGELYFPSTPDVLGAPDPSVMPEFFGDVILVNGQAWPKLEVEPRPYRLRLLNGSDSRFYVLYLSNGRPFVQVGTDTGLLAEPVTLDRLTIGPGERADVVIDFSSAAGTTVILRNNGRSPFPKGAPVDPRTTGQIMAFAVTKPLAATPKAVLPAVLRTPIAPLVQTGPTRRLLLFEGIDEHGRLKPMLGTVADGALEWGAPLTERVALGDTEVWEVFNTTMDAHPIHLHLVSFQIQGRQKFRAVQDPATAALSGIRLLGGQRPAAPNERGWKDTAQMLPGEVTRVIAHFDRAGEYVWHCHILSHEDHEMMRPYEVVAP
jgi:spore coat protein A, manganese oxidase